MDSVCCDNVGVVVCADVKLVDLVQEFIIYESIASKLCIMDYI